MTDRVGYYGGDGEKILRSRAADAMHAVCTGRYVVSDFYDPLEQTILREQLEKGGFSEDRDYLFFGGYPFAERRILFFLPEYLHGLHADVTAQRAFLVQSARTYGAVGAVRVQGSGFREMSHRDYLGSLTGLGIERSVIGDIVPCDPFCAVVFFCQKIGVLLLNELCRIGKEAVRVTDETPALEAGSLFLQDPHRYAPFTDTVASLRLDCLIAIICSVSREQAQQKIERGMVRLDYRTVEKCDYSVQPPCCISIHGYGRFRFERVAGISRRGRLRIFLQKYL